MTDKTAKPFLKWAGGKTQLINDIENALPKYISKEKFTYIETFVGSGAVLFWMLNNFPKLQKAVINDINEDLINTYRTIATKPKELISILETLQNEYHGLEGKDEVKKEYYYSKRELFNKRMEEQSGKDALFIFLNRTCFNELYRVNRSNEYNVPMGSYKRATICVMENILAKCQLIQKVEIICGDQEEILNHAENKKLFKFDPTYELLSETSSITSNTKDKFKNEEQIRLIYFCYKRDTLNHTWLLSNLEVNYKDENANIVDDLNADSKIERVNDKRSINSNPENFYIGVTTCAWLSVQSLRSAAKFLIRSLTQLAA
jgi:DNA adenine methylase